MFRFKYFFIYSLCVIAQIFAIEENSKKFSRKPYYTYSIQKVNNVENLDDLIKTKKYSSKILYIEKRPASLSDEEYAEKIINLQNSLNLPEAFRSEKTEIIDYLKTENDFRRKRQTDNTYGNNIKITVTIYAKDDTLIIKEVIPDVPSVRNRYYVETSTATSTRQPNRVVENWYPTLRTNPVFGTTTPSTSNRSYDRHATAATMTTPWPWSNYRTTTRSTTTARPVNWGFNLYDFTTTPTPAPTTTTKHLSYINWFTPPETVPTTQNPLLSFFTTTPSHNPWDRIAEETTTTRSPSLGWGLPWNIDYEITTIIPETTTARSPSFGWGWNTDYGRTTIMEEPTTREHYHNSWDITTSTTTTEARPETTTEKSFIWNIFG